LQANNQGKAHKDSSLDKTPAPSPPVFLQHVGAVSDIIRSFEAFPSDEPPGTRTANPTSQNRRHLRCQPKRKNHSTQGAKTTPYPSAKNTPHPTGNP